MTKNVRVVNSLIAAAKTTEEILVLCGQIAAVLAIAFLFFDAIRCIVKHRNFKLSVTALAFLSVAAVLFLVGQFAFQGIVSVILSIVSLVFLVGYLICDILIVFGNIKRNKKNMQNEQSENGEAHAADAPEDEVAEAAVPTHAEETAQEKSDTADAEK